MPELYEILFRRKSVREFLDQYASKHLNQIIAIVTEIGISYIRKNFNAPHFSFEELKYILGIYL